MEVNTKSPPKAPEGGTAKSRYEMLAHKRQPFLDRARKNSELTIPTLIPPDGYDGMSKLYQPYQGLGARGIRNLAAKLGLALFPPNVPFMKTQATEEVLMEAEQENGPEQRAIIEQELSRFDKMVKDNIEATADRTIIDEMGRHLQVAGNAALDLTDNDARLFKLDSYVVLRSPRGLVVEAILREEVAFAALPDDLREHMQEASEETYERHSVLEMFTWIVLKGGKYHVHQEVNGFRDPQSEALYKKENLPYLFLRFNRVDGDHYGRAFIDELYGDLVAYETISQALIEAGAIASTVKFGVNPNGTTKVSELNKARNGGYFTGNEGDVWTMRVDKMADLQFTERLAISLENRLEEQFMLNSSVQRHAERVTAEEIRYLAEELDASLSGIYTLMGQEFQKPYGLLKIKAFIEKKLIPNLPKESVKYTVLTGLDALGRSTDLRKLDALLQGVAEVFGSEALAQEVNVQNYIQRRAAALGVDPEGLFKSDEQKAEEQQQAQMVGVLQGAAPGAIQEVIKQNGGPQAAPS